MRYTLCPLLAMSTLSSEELARMIEDSVHLTMELVLQRLVEDNHNENVSTIAVVLHHIVELKETPMETSFHARLMASREKKPKHALRANKWCKMVVCLDTNKKSFVLVFDDATAAASATCTFEDVLQIGQPLIICPNRWPAKHST